MYPYAWSGDDREAIKDLSDIDSDLIEETDAISAFLNQRRCHYFGVATKGGGKALLLLP